jgi:hypothetical protein
MVQLISGTYAQFPPKHLQVVYQLFSQTSTAIKLDLYFGRLTCGS